MASRCQSCEVTASYKYWNELPSTKKSFFKVLADDFRNELEIPEEFTECFKGELAEWCTLRGATGLEWRVMIARTLTHASFFKGWPKFVKDNGLGFLDLCVFTYSEPSTFDVLMFKMSGSEREGAYFTNISSSLAPLICTSSLHSQRNNADHASSGEGVVDEEEKRAESEKSGMMEEIEENGTAVKKSGKRKAPETTEEFDDSSEDEYTEDDSDKEEVVEVMANRRRRSRASGSTRPKQLQTVHISRRREVTKGEIQHANDLANEFMISVRNEQVPIIKIEMRPTHVYQGFHMTIPKEWALKHLWLKAHDVKLRIPGEQGSWIVGCRWTANLTQCQLRTRWALFVLDNNLEEHDVCIFELVRKGNPKKRINGIINVHIFRVVEEKVPLKKVRKMLM